MTEMQKPALSTGLIKVIYHGSIAARPSNDDAELAFRELHEKSSHLEAKKVVIRCSLFGFQAKWWPSGQYVLDLNCVNLRLVSIAGRSVSLIFKDTVSPKSSSLTAKHTMYGFYCESEAVAYSIASSMLQIARTITASVRELKYAGAVEAIVARSNDSEIFITNYQPNLEVEHASLPNYASGGSKPEAFIYDLLAQTAVSISSSIESLTDKTFLPRLKSLEMALVIFLLPNNQYCNVVENQLERAAPKLLTCTPPIHVCKVNLLTDRKQAKKLGITADKVPVMAVYRRGKAGQYNGPDDSPGIVAYMRAQQRRDNNVFEDDNNDTDSPDFAAMVDSDTRQLRTAVEDDSLGAMLSQLSAADVEVNALNSSLNDRPERDVLAYRSMLYGVAQPTRAFVRALANSLRLGVENTDLTILPEVCERNFFDTSTGNSHGWSPRDGSFNKQREGRRDDEGRRDEHAFIAGSQMQVGEPRITAWDSPKSSTSHKAQQRFQDDSYVDANALEHSEPPRWGSTSNNNANANMAPFVI